MKGASQGTIIRITIAGYQKTKTPIFAKLQLNLKSAILNLKLNEHSSK